MVFLYAGVWALSVCRPFLSPGLILRPLVVGISRVVVGRHCPSDVLAGVALVRDLRGCSGVTGEKRATSPHPRSEAGGRKPT